MDWHPLAKRVEVKSGKRSAQREVARLRKCRDSESREKQFEEAFGLVNRS